MVSPLNLRQFSAELLSHPGRGEVNYVLHDIAHGFDIGYLPSPSTCARDNKASEVVDAHVLKEF